MIRLYILFAFAADASGKLDQQSEAENNLEIQPQQYREHRFNFQPFDDGFKTIIHELQKMDCELYDLYWQIRMRRRRYDYIAHGFERVDREFQRMGRAFERLHGKFVRMNRKLDRTHLELQRMSEDGELSQYREKYCLHAETEHQYAKMRKQYQDLSREYEEMDRLRDVLVQKYEVLGRRCRIHEVSRPAMKLINYWIDQFFLFAG